MVLSLDWGGRDVDCGDIEMRTGDLCHEVELAGLVSYALERALLGIKLRLYVRGGLFVSGTGRSASFEES